MKRKKKVLSGIFSMVIVVLCLVPFLFVLVSSVIQGAGGISFQAYYDVFLGTPRYLLRFWRSLFVCLCIAGGQMVVSVLAGYGFARYRFRGNKIMFFALMILMTLPLQVTLVPNYIILNKMQLLGSQVALILPGIFMSLGTIIMRYTFVTISDEIIDAAKLDGCGVLKILGRIAIPISKGCLICVGLLSFLDAWNMVEQPIAYLKEFDNYPLSVALAYVAPENLSRQLVSCILAALPPLLLFAFFKEELVKGIVFAEEK